jgi:hypothetical protein
MQDVQQDISASQSRTQRGSLIPDLQHIVLEMPVGTNSLTIYQHCQAFTSHGHLRRNRSFQGYWCKPSIVPFIWTIPHAKIVQQYAFLPLLSKDSNNTVVGIVRNKAATVDKISKDEELKGRSNIHILEADLTSYDALKAREPCHDQPLR